MSIEKIDFKTEAQQFVRENNCPPVCIIEKAIKRGAELGYDAALGETIQQVREAANDLRLRHSQNLAGVSEMEVHA